MAVGATLQEPASDEFRCPTRAEAVTDESTPPTVRDPSAHGPESGAAADDIVVVISPVVARAGGFLTFVGLAVWRRSRPASSDVPPGGSGRTGHLGTFVTAPYSGPLSSDNVSGGGSSAPSRPAAAVCARNSVPPACES